MNEILKIEHLNKKFGQKTILNDVTFSVNSGEVFGFLGPNGAGKTTTIKIATGLISMNSGSIEVCGHNVHSDFEKAIINVGAIVENPEMYKYLSGWDNLMQYARIRGVKDKKRIKEVVEIVKLNNRIKELVKKYSLGMRQRLGIAQAILHKPKLLIFDEPTNGLDPFGIKELRDIFKHLAHEEGCAIMVSSHLMSEMELMCDRVGIIVEGKIVDVKLISELTSAVGGGKVLYRIKVADTDGLDPNSIKIIDKNFFEVAFESENAESALQQFLAETKLIPLQIVPVENKSLEEAFMELTNKNDGGQIK
ncbi:MAG: ABC transporter ATP-binding protein [Ruminococcus sp.]|nr:ABC transporter ATP-binding protein [Ruminococcus sp.]